MFWCLHIRLSHLTEYSTDKGNIFNPVLFQVESTEDPHREVIGTKTSEPIDSEPSDTGQTLRICISKKFSGSRC